MKKFIIKIFVYAFFLLVLLNVISFYILKNLSNSEFYKPQFVKNYNEESEFDYVVLGSSLGLTTLNTKEIDKYFNYSGLNISMDDSYLNSHYLMLQHFYKSNKRTKKLILCLNYEDTSSTTYQLNNNDYRFLTEIDSKYISEYFYQMESDYIKKLYLSKFFPVIGVSYYNYEVFFPSILTIFNKKKHNKFDDKGNFFYPNNNTKKVNVDYKLEKVKIKNIYFGKIYNFCKENNIELIVYQSPVFGKKIVYDNLPKEVQFVNHSDLIESDLFYDNIHVNSKGRTFCTLAFCKEIKNP